MDSFRPQRSPGSDRFLGLLTDAAPSNGSAGVELHEDDVFWPGADSDAADPSKPSSPMAIPSPNPSFPKSSFRRLPDRNFGILAALPEEENPLPFLQRKTSINSASSISTTTSPSSSARMIPSIPKPRPLDYPLSIPRGYHGYHQSAPVNVPVPPPKPKKDWADLDFDSAGGEEDGEEDEMLPPHEIVARASARDSPMTTFSVLEGAGRTLKGRDLRRVRNAVWRKTGFLD